MQGLITIFLIIGAAISGVHAFAEQTIFVPDGREGFRLPKEALRINDTRAFIHHKDGSRSFVQLISAGYLEEGLSPAAFQSHCEAEIFANAGWEAQAGGQTQLFGSSATWRTMLHRQHKRLLSLTFFKAEETPHLLLIESNAPDQGKALGEKCRDSAFIDSARSSRREKLRRSLSAKDKLSLHALEDGKGMLSLVLLAHKQAVAFRAGEIRLEIRDESDQIVTEITRESAFSLCSGVKGVTMPRKAASLHAFFNGSLIVGARLILPPSKSKE